MKIESAALGATPAARRALGLASAGRQRGQAILWFLLTAAACCATLALVYWSIALPSSSLIARYSCWK